jgi:FKBP-type peptidyl-prolyl cis-trans isomerase FkpA
VAAPKPAVAKPATAPAKPAAAKPVAPAKPAPPKALETEDEKAIYALGLSIYGQMQTFDLTPAELELLKRAITDAANKTPAGKLDEWGPKINALAQTRRQKVVERQKIASAEYLAKCATEPFALKTESGVVYREITAGTGPSPKATDQVKVHYKGTLIDGTEFDSSYKRNEPATFPLNGVIKCWTEGVAKMKVGGKARLVCPADLAYGDQGRPGIPPAAVLIFEIELLEIVGSPAPAGQ